MKLLRKVMLCNSAIECVAQCRCRTGVPGFLGVAAENDGGAKGKANEGTEFFADMICGFTILPAFCHLKTFSGGRKCGHWCGLATLCCNLHC